ncbi:MAG: hypothetical protein IPL77_11225 [Flavobacteriales bacterium]|nr:hypothetical protein [Flavobacteriales bacterium]
MVRFLDVPNGLVVQVQMLMQARPDFAPPLCDHRRMDIDVAILRDRNARRIGAAEHAEIGKENSGRPGERLPIRSHEAGASRARHLGAVPEALT